MAKLPAAWLSGQGDDSMVVLSTRVRLARNVAGALFPPQADDETKQRIISYFDSARSRSPLLGDGEYHTAAEINDLDRQFLIERHLISPVFLDGDPAKSVFIGNDQRVSIMVNEEDHLRIQALSAGLNPQESFQMALRYENELNGMLEFNYDNDFGYLTACPTNAGTGMRASVLIHLPGLVLTREIDRIINRLTTSGLVVRGFYGEGSDVLGNLFQISNQYTLGITEEEIINQISRATADITEEEAAARQRLVDEAGDMIEDKIWRAYGILKHARVLTSDEVMNLLSAIRLGRAMKILDGIDVALINEILLLSQPAHLQKFFGQEMDNNKRDFVRAQMVRDKLRNINA
ncbi:MAG: protein arginine kinase [candidate division Zixibacteria bacterium]|nr:protein arginine kinase [candidate division Zixibacteria bacterium]